MQCKGQAEFCPPRRLLRLQTGIARRVDVALQRKLDSWVEAGLIDAATSARIMAFERQDSRPMAIWAAVALGLLAVVLGVLLLISATWDRIPDWLKLGVHMALLLGCGGWFWRAYRQRRKWLAEGLLFLLAGLVVAGIALQAQVYQLTGPVWASLLLWLALVAPVLLLAGQTRLTGTLLALLGVGAPAAMAIATIDDGGLWLLAQGLAMASPFVLLLLAAGISALRPAFHMALIEIGCGIILSATSLVHFAWAFTIDKAQAMDSLLRMLPVAVLAAACYALLRRRRDPAGFLHPRLLPPLLFGSVLAAALALAVPHADNMLSRLIGVLLFAGFWGWVAQAAAVTRQERLFALAIAAIAIRIFIIYLELFGSLAATGSGLVLGGALLVALSWGWQRLTIRRQKRRPGKAEEPLEGPSA